MVLVQLKREICKLSEGWWSINFQWKNEPCADCGDTEDPTVSSYSHYVWSAIDVNTDAFLTCLDRFMIIADFFIRRAARMLQIYPFFHVGSPKFHVHRMFDVLFQTADCVNPDRTLCFLPRTSIYSSSDFVSFSFFEKFVNLGPCARRCRVGLVDPGCVRGWSPPTT